MTKICIKNGRVILSNKILKNVAITISDSKIAAVGADLPLNVRLLRRKRVNSHPPRNDDATIIDARGCYVAPGFIDCHIHGEPEKIFANEAKHGTTSFVIAQSCAPLRAIYKNVEKIKEFIKGHPFGPNVLGLRLEGPYISRAKAGAQNPSYIKTPNAKELAAIIKKIWTNKKAPGPFLKMMTIAPELKGAEALIKILHRAGVVASIGHSDATYEEAIGGVDAGIRHATHTFNAMSGMDRREPGVVGAVLTDGRVTAEIILDLIHVRRELFGLLLKAKGPEKVIVVTDSITADGAVYRLKDGRLAGSALTMIQALKNAVKLCNVSLIDAIRLVTLNPAKLLGLEKSKGSIGVGKDADIVIFDKDFNVKMTMIRGKIAFMKGKICAG